MSIAICGDRQADPPFSTRRCAPGGCTPPLRGRIRLSGWTPESTCSHRGYAPAFGGSPAPPPTPSARYPPRASAGHPAPQADLFASLSRSGASPSRLPALASQARCPGATLAFGSPFGCGTGCPALASLAWGGVGFAPRFASPAGAG